MLDEGRKKDHGLSMAVEAPAPITIPKAKQVLILDRAQLVLMWMMTEVIRFERDLVCADNGFVAPRSVLDGQAFLQCFLASISASLRERTSSQSKMVERRATTPPSRSPTTTTTTTRRDEQ